jgi:hypothetical protein
MAFCRNCGATLPPAAKFCPACGVPVYASGRNNEVTHNSFQIAGKPKIVINLRTPGSVDVRRGEAGVATADADVKEPESIDYSARQEGDLITIGSRTKSWNPLIWGSYAFSGGPRTNVRVTIPADSDLTVETQTDSITVSGISGSISAETKTGPIHLKDCDGTFSIKTHTGNVDMDDVNGTVDVRNTIGNVNYSGALSAGVNTFRATTGDIEVALKGTPDLSLDSSTTVGRIVCRLELTESHYDRGDFVGQHLTGRMGSGRGKLVIEATTGSISIYRAAN